MQSEIRRARRGDLGQIERLLRDADLTTLGVADQLRGFLVAEDGTSSSVARGLRRTGLRRFSAPSWFDPTIATGGSAADSLKICSIGPKVMRSIQSIS